MSQRMAMAAGVMLVVLGGRFAPAQPAKASAQSSPAAGEVRLTYLGNAGWEITDGKTVILVDPFLTQFARWTGAPGNADGPAPDARLEHRQEDGIAAVQRQVLDLGLFDGLPDGGPTRVSGNLNRTFG